MTPPLFSEPMTLSRSHKLIAVAGILVFVGMVLGLRMHRESNSSARLTSNDARDPDHLDSRSSVPNEVHERQINVRSGSWRDFLQGKIAEMDQRTDPARYEFQAESWQQLVRELPARELGTVFRELTNLQLSKSTESGRDLQMRILQRWAEIDIRSAASEIMTLSPEMRGEACERVATLWARQNLQDATAWTRNLADGKDRQRAVAGIAAEAVADHPAEVLTLASETPLPPERHDLIQQAASGWAATAPVQAVNWAKQIQDSAMREEVLASIAATWADSNPDEAARLAIDSLSPGPVQENVVMGIMQRMAGKDMAGTRLWVAQFPEGELRARAEKELQRIEERQELVHRAN